MSKKILTIINTKIDLVQDTLNTLVKKDEEPVSDDTVSPSINYQTDVEAMQPAQSDISTLTPPQGSEVNGSEATVSEATVSEVNGSEVSGSEVTSNEVTGSEVTGSEVTSNEVSGSEEPSNEAIGSDATTLSEEPKKGGKFRTNKRRKNNRNKSKNRRR
jgi:hypothetical protein